MKNINLITKAILFSTLLFTCYQCSSSQIKFSSINKPFQNYANSNNEIPCSFDLSPGWINIHRLQLTIIASPSKKTKNAEKRKKQALKYVQECMEQGITNYFFRSNPVVLLRKEFTPIQTQLMKLLQNAKVIEASFDEKQNHKRIVQIEANNLKKLFQKEKLLTE